MKSKKDLISKLDIKMIIIPIAVLLFICVLFGLFPIGSKETLVAIRGFLSNHLGFFYIFIALIFFVSTIFLAFSKYGNIRLGNREKPRYSNIKWGLMVFTSTMSADVIFYSLCEWMMYSKEPFIQTNGGVRKIGLAYSLFHWGPLAWGFYIMLAVAFGYMLYVGKRQKQKFSEACRPILGKRVDGILGKIIDLLAIFALIAGTATTFSMSMPLITLAASKIFHVPNTKFLTVIIMILVVVIYTSIVVRGMNGISKLATLCSILFFTLLGYFFFFGGQGKYIIQHGMQSLGYMVSHFPQMSLTNNPIHPNGFAQNWTIYFWSYWMVWCVATPFFIGSISEGKTIRSLILGGYGWGLSGTYLSFIILSNYGLSMQFNHHVGILATYDHTGKYAEAILKIFSTMPLSFLGLILLALTMIGLYSTVFDSLTMVISTYSYKELMLDQEPDKKVRVFWAIMFIVLPITLVLTGNSVYDIQSVSIIAAFPIGLVMILILLSFYKELIIRRNLM